MANNSIQDLFNVRGLVAVITGGGSGLGLYAARALDANGAKSVCKHMDAQEEFEILVNLPVVVGHRWPPRGYASRGSEDCYQWYSCTTSLPCR